MKRKLWSLMLVLCMVSCLFAGCKKKQDTDADAGESNSQPTEEVGNVDNKNEEKKDEYLSDLYLQAVNQLDTADLQKIELGTDMGIEVKLGGTLQTLLGYYISAFGGKAPSKFNAKLWVELDQKDKSSCVSTKFKINGETLEAKLLIKDTTLYVGIPSLTDQYLKVELSEIIPDLSAELEQGKFQMTEQDIEKFQKLCLDYIKEIATCASKEKKEDNATETIQNTKLDLKASVSGTKYVEKLDGKKLKEMGSKYQEELNRLFNLELDEDDLEIQEEIKDVLVEYVKAEDGSFAIILVNDRQGKIKVINNAEYFAMSFLKAEATEDDVVFYAKKRDAKTGDIYLVNDGEVLTEFSLEYQLLEDGIKLTATIEDSEEGMLLVGALVMTKTEVELQVQMSSQGEKWVDATAFWRTRDVKDIPSVDSLDIVEDEKIWTRNFSMEQVDSLLKNTVGLSLEQVLEIISGGSDGEDYDSEFEYEDSGYDSYEPDAA